MLNLGAEINQRDDKGFTPLHRAAYLAQYDGYMEIYEYLLVSTFNSAALHSLIRIIGQLEYAKAGYKVTGEAVSPTVGRSLFFQLPEMLYSDHRSSCVFAEPRSRPQHQDGKL